MAGAVNSKSDAPRPRIRIVTINLDSFADTARLLQALRALDYPAGEVTVVDNGSTDGSLARLQREFPEARYLPLGRNAGFGAANNAALREALAEDIPYVWLINNDAVPDPDALGAMVTSLEAAPDAGAAGCLVLDDDPAGRLQAWGGGRILPWLGAVRGIASAAQSPEFITGASLLLRTAALRQTGLFDERFFLYWEDADLCFRLRQAGWRLVVAEAKVRHRGSATTGRTPYLRSFHSARSYVLFLDKHARQSRLKSFTAAAFQSACKILRGNLPAAAGFWAGRHAGLAARRTTGASRSSCD